MSNFGGMTSGANVARAARMADNFAIADAGVKEGGILSATAKWHEQQSIRTLSKSIARSRDKEEIASEQSCAAQEMLARRAQRLKELFDAENKQYQMELAEVGLVMEDPQF